jgi:hypothetical protein
MDGWILEWMDSLMDRWMDGWSFLIATA